MLYRYKFIIITFCILFLNNNLYAQSDTKKDSLLKITKFGKEDIKTINALNKLAGIYLYNNTDSALFFAKTAKKLSEKISYKEGTAESCNYLGRADIILGHYKESYNNFYKALRIYEKLKDTMNIAKIYSNIGTIHYYQKNFKKARKFFDLAIQIYISEDYKEGIANIYNNLGLIYSDRDVLDTAEYYFLNTVKIAEETGNTKIEISALGNIARLYMIKGEYEKAAEAFFKITEKAEDVNDKSVFSVTYTNIAMAYLNMAETEKNKKIRLSLLHKAVKYGDMALKEAEGLKSHSLRSYAFYVLAETYKKLENYKKALEYYEKLTAVNDSIFNKEKTEAIASVEAKYQNEKKQLQIDNLEKEKVADYEIIKRQKVIIAVSAAGFILVTTLSVFLFMLYRSKNKALKLLDEKNKNITEQREKISAQRDKISEIAFELKKVNRTKNKLFTIIAHDLKNPFQGIIGFSEMIKNKAKQEDLPEILKYAEFIYDASNQTYRLLDNLLDFTRSQTGLVKFSPKNVSIKSIAEEGTIISKNNAEAKGVNIIEEIDDTVTAYVDKSMIITVVRNLVSNAVKFTPKGGTVKIKAFEKHNDVIIEISDTGVGIKDVDIPKLFRADLNFSTFGTQNEKGTGLGLVVCKDFILKNNGSISVKSKVGKGSIFTVILPGKKSRK